MDINKLFPIFCVIIIALTCGCVATAEQKNTNTSDVVAPSIQPTSERTMTTQEEAIVEPLYSAGDVVEKDIAGYLVILSVNNGTYTVRYTVQDAGEAMPGHFEVSDRAFDVKYSNLHKAATGIYMNVDPSSLEEKNTAFAEHQYAEAVSETEAKEKAEAKALAMYGGSLPGTYFEISGSHKWEATFSFDGNKIHEYGSGSTRIIVPKGTDFAQCSLDLDFDDYYDSGSNFDSGWLELILYSPNREILREEKDQGGISSYIHMTYSF